MKVKTVKKKPWVEPGTSRTEPRTLVEYRVTFIVTVDEVRLADEEDVDDAISSIVCDAINGDDKKLGIVDAVEFEVNLLGTKS